MVGTHVAWECVCDGGTCEKYEAASSYSFSAYFSTPSALSWLCRAGLGSAERNFLAEGCFSHLSRVLIRESCMYYGLLKSRTLP